MRLGKPMEHLQAALKAGFAPGPFAETITTIARQIGYFGYLTYDVLVWVCVSMLQPNIYDLEVYIQS
jgi:peroxin-11B